VPSAHVDSLLLDRLHALPKVDLHRHLEGSLRLATVTELASRFGVGPDSGNGALRALVQVVDGDPRSWDTFLSKFETLRLLYRTPEIIQRIVDEAIEDAAVDHVQYLELHFTPAALSQQQGFSLGDVFDCVIDAAVRAAARTGIQVGLIASVNRHESVTLAEEVAGLAADRMAQGVVGVDLAGNEAEFPALPFLGIFSSARQAGLGITLHAGEWSGPGSVREAIEAMGAARIAHGGRVMEDPDTIALARDHRTVFEICLTSNLHSGVATDLDHHPLPRMIEAGLQVTLNTDDPGISAISLSDEYALAVDRLGLSVESMKGLILAAAQASFLPGQARLALESRLQAQLFPA
jgi:adenosine deaminase